MSKMFVNKKKIKIMHRVAVNVLKYETSWMKRLVEDRRTLEG